MLIGRSVSMLLDAFILSHLPPPLPQVEDKAEPGLLLLDDVRTVQRDLLRPGELTGKGQVM